MTAARRSARVEIRVGAAAGLTLNMESWAWLGARMKFGSGTGTEFRMLARVEFVRLA